MEEMTDGSLVLLVFDPGCHQMKKFPTSTDVGSLMYLLRKGIGSLTSRQYQILSVHGLIYDPADKQVTDCVIVVVLWSCVEATVCPEKARCLNIFVNNCKAETN